MRLEIRRTRLAYEAYLDDVRVGDLAFSKSGTRYTALHTEVEPAAEGKGVGSALARAFLDDVRSSGGTLVVQCPFVASFLERHDDYADLVAT